MEKVASSLVRANVKDAYEAMLYLNKKRVNTLENNISKEDKKEKNQVKEEALNIENKWWE